MSSNLGTRWQAVFDAALERDVDIDAMVKQCSRELFNRSVSSVNSLTNPEQLSVLTCLEQRLAVSPQKKSTDNGLQVWQLILAGVAVGLIMRGLTKS